MEPLHPAAAAQEERGASPLLQRPDHRVGEEVRDAEIPLPAGEEAPGQDAAAQREAGEAVPPPRGTAPLPGRSGPAVQLLSVHRSRGPGWLGVRGEGVLGRFLFFACGLGRAPGTYRLRDYPATFLVVVAQVKTWFQNRRAKWRRLKQVRRCFCFYRNKYFNCLILSCARLFQVVCRSHLKGCLTSSP